MIYEVEVRGEVVGQSALAQMADMLRYDAGDVIETTTTPVEGRPWDSFTAVVHLASYTPARWRSFGLPTRLLRSFPGDPPPARFNTQEEVSRFMYP